MKKFLNVAVLACTVVGSAFAQVKMTQEQMVFYTSDWKGDRFADGRPKVPDDLLKRAVDVSIEDVWDFLREKGYQNQYEGNWQALHIDKPFAGRALTAQYMPYRPDMGKAIVAEGKREGRVGEPDGAVAVEQSGRSEQLEQRDERYLHRDHQQRDDQQEQRVAEREVPQRPPSALADTESM